MKKIVIAIVLALGIGYTIGWARESYQWSKVLAQHEADLDQLRPLSKYNS